MRAILSVAMRVEQAQTLQGLARERGVSLSQLVREAIERAYPELVDVEDEGQGRASGRRVKH